MYVRTLSFLFLGLDKVLLLISFLFFISVLSPLCSHSCIHCVLHDLGCVVEMYCVPIGRRSSDASRRPSRSPPLMRATYHLFVIDDFHDLFIHPTLASRIYPALTYLYYHYRSSFDVLFSPFHSPLCSELVPLAP